MDEMDHRRMASVADANRAKPNLGSLKTTPCIIGLVARRSETTG